MCQTYSHSCFCIQELLLCLTGIGCISVNNAHIKPGECNIFCWWVILPTSDIYVGHTKNLVFSCTLGFSCTMGKNQNIGKGHTNGLVGRVVARGPPAAHPSIKQFTEKKCRDSSAYSKCPAEINQALELCLRAVFEEVVSRRQKNTWAFQDPDCPLGSLCCVPQTLQTY